LNLKRAHSLDSVLTHRPSTPPSSPSQKTEVSDMHICVLCLKALMNNSVSVTWWAHDSQFIWQRDTWQVSFGV